MILQQLHVRQNSGSSFMTQDVLNQSNFRILLSSVFLEGINQYISFFTGRLSWGGGKEGNKDEKENWK